MKGNGIERELLARENEYWQAIKDKNADAVLRLSDDPCILTGPNGVRSIHPAALASMMKTMPYELHEFRIRDDAQVRQLAEDVAVLAYDVHEELTVDGAPVTIDAAEASTWVRRNGRWVCAMHSESLRGDPFGRDRRPH
jgi:hypothetical protein